MLWSIHHSATFILTRHPKQTMTKLYCTHPTTNLLTIQHRCPELCNTWLDCQKHVTQYICGWKILAHTVKKKHLECYKWPCVSVHKISHPVSQHQISLSAKSFLVCISASGSPISGHPLGCMCCILSMSVQKMPMSKGRRNPGRTVRGSRPYVVYE